MRFTKVALIALVAYAGLITAFESMIGILQPEAGSVLVITTTDADGSAHDRVVARLESEGKLYVAANHWPRAWYRRALANPEVRATLEGQTRGYRAVQVSPEEHERVNREHPLGAGFRFVTGFPPREFLRLDPR
jgi:hypothetical protein